ncbi:MAG TPA: NAD-dependent epimerase/dehydratase family protein [Balneolales bacterium]|nr:NAD-dependent epimerase/dehydratase family protein [Balneolales bacterium]
MSKKEIILVTGALGQIGSSLVKKLRDIYGEGQVIATDVRHPDKNGKSGGIFEVLNVLNKKRLQELVHNQGVTQIYHLAALLSATGEQHPHEAWHLNINGLLNVLEVAREQSLTRVYWPSSIAVFGDHSPKINTPQITVMDPSTIYGISKIAGESWCKYYYKRYGLDVRSIRYPGIIGYDALPGGGTTDYAVDIFHKAIGGEVYSCFLKPDTRLPMMYMPDAIRATLELMHAEGNRLTVHSSYNISGCSFTPHEIAEEIKKHIPGLEVSYQPDQRQNIADSWPESINDQPARDDWNWHPEYDLPLMTSDMLTHLKEKLEAKE